MEWSAPMVTRSIKEYHAIIFRLIIQNLHRRASAIDGTTPTNRWAERQRADSMSESKEEGEA